MVMFTPSGALLIKHGSSAPTTLLAILGLSTPFIRRYRSFTTEEKRLFANVVFFVGIVFLSTLCGGVFSEAVKMLGHYARLLLVIPIIFLCARIRLTQDWLWYAMAIGAITAGLFALYESWQMGVFKNTAYRAHGMTGPMIFGHLSLTMGFMTIAGWGFFKEQGQRYLIIPSLALILGLVASFLSGTRGAWIAIPALSLLYFWFMRRRGMRQWHITIILMVLGSIIAAGYLFPQTGIKKRIDIAQKEIELLFAADKKLTTVEGVEGGVDVRLKMWSAAWKIFLENPLLGVGEGMYQEKVREFAESDNRYKKIVKYGFKDPDNEYFYTLVNRGLLGLISLLLLFLFPAWMFYKAASSESPTLARLGLAGLVLIVAYMHFCMTKSVLSVSVELNFFSFSLALLVSLISSSYWQMSKNEKEY